MSQDVHELVRFTELYQESLDRIFTSGAVPANENYAGPGTSQEERRLEPHPRIGTCHNTRLLFHPGVLSAGGALLHSIPRSISEGSDIPAIFRK